MDLLRFLIFLRIAANVFCGVIPAENTVVNAQPINSDSWYQMSPEKLAKILTAKISAPVVLLSSKMAAAAGALPPLMAAKGAVVGSAIAKPVAVGAVKISGITSGLTGLIVSLPIAIIESGKGLWKSQEGSLGDGVQAVKQKAVAMGHILLKPFAIIAGTTSKITEYGSELEATGNQVIEKDVEIIGSKISTPVEVVGGTGADILGWGVDQGSDIIGKIRDGVTTTLHAIPLIGSLVSNVAHGSTVDSTVPETVQESYKPVVLGMSIDHPPKITH